LFFLAFCALGAPALTVGSGCSSEAQASQPTTPDEVQEDRADGALASKLAPVRSYDPNQSLAPMLATVQPAVVSIQAGSDGPFGAQPSGIGSGFIISADGQVVTNHHVVAGRNVFEVELKDGRRFRGRVIGSDPQTDLAVLELEGASALPTVGFGSSEVLQVGDWVVAVGSPMGLSQTVTRGIISAKGRGSLGLYQDGYADFLQTDAA
ncbi:MAG: trypsin-like peptidase domain-containing protein, partial [Myxococcales bacterium]|nr:trypsin-like peptidase domain-containing protein [Myxococcales bacterium]